MFKFALGQRAVAIVGSTTGVTGVVSNHAAYLNGSRHYGFVYLSEKGAPEYTAVQELYLAPVEGESTQDIPYDFTYPLGATVEIKEIGQSGKVTGALRNNEGQTQYLVVYDAAGKLDEEWIEESLLDEWIFS